MHKVIHSLEVGKKEGFLLKLDMSKAYDRVEWNFLMAIVRDFSFDAQVCKLIF